MSSITSSGSKDSFAHVTVGGVQMKLKSVNTDFFVIQEEAPGILVKNTAVKLGLLKLELDNVNSVNDRKTELMSKCPLCFIGIGKLKDYRLKIPIDPEVTPVVQPLRRIAYHLRGKKKLDELVQLDIIEKVEASSPWVSPVVAVP
eukprot:XP_011434799.1 PREDICTED: uncharacterized protein LOC105333494 [Crassostrea gigas]